MTVSSGLPTSTFLHLHLLLLCPHRPALSPTVVPPALLLFFLYVSLAFAPGQSGHAHARPPGRSLPTPLSTELPLPGIHQTRSEEAFQPFQHLHQFLAAETINSNPASMDMRVLYDQEHKRGG